MAVRTVGGKGKQVGDRRLRRQAQRRRQQRSADQAVRAQAEQERALIQSLVDQRYSPVQAALSRELRTAQHTPTAVTQAWNSYQDNLAAARAQSTEQANQAIARSQNLGANAAGAQVALANQQTQNAQGRPIDGGQGTLGNQIGALLGAYGATYQQDREAQAAAVQTRFDAARAQGAFAQNAQIAQAHGRVNELLGKQRDLEAEKGQYAYKVRQDLADKAFEQALAEQTLGVKIAEQDRRFQLDTQKLQLDAADTRADNARQDAQLDLKGTELAARINDWTEKRRQKDRELDIRERGRSTPKLSAAKKDQWRSRKARVLSLRDAFKGKLASGEYANTGQISAELKKLGYSRDELNMARDLAVLGYLSPANRRAAGGYFPGGIVPQGFVANAR